MLNVLDSKATHRAGKGEVQLQENARTITIVQQFVRQRIQNMEQNAEAFGGTQKRRNTLRKMRSMSKFNQKYSSAAFARPTNAIQTTENFSMSTLPDVEKSVANLTGHTQNINNTKWLKYHSCEREFRQ